MNGPDATLHEKCRDLARYLHDEMRRDIPDLKVFGKQLKPPPWSQQRLDGLAGVLAAAIRAGRDERVAALEQEVAILRAEVRYLTTGEAA